MLRRLSRLLSILVDLSRDCKDVENSIVLHYVAIKDIWRRFYSRQGAAVPEPMANWRVLIGGHCALAILAQKLCCAIKEGSGPSDRPAQEGSMSSP